MKDLRHQINDTLNFLMTFNTSKDERAKMLVEFSKKVKKKHKNRFKI